MQEHDLDEDNGEYAVEKKMTRHILDQIIEAVDYAVKLNPNLKWCDVLTSIGVNLVSNTIAKAYHNTPKDAEAQLNLIARAMKKQTRNSITAYRQEKAQDKKQ